MATKGRRNRDDDLTIAEYDRRTRAWMVLGIGVFGLAISGAMLATGFVPEPGYGRRGRRRSAAFGLLFGGLLTAGGALAVWRTRRRRKP